MRFERFDIVLRLVFKLMLLLLMILLVGIVLTLLEELVSALLLIVLLLDAMASDRVALMVVTGSSSGCAAKVSDCTDSVSEGEISNQFLSSADIYSYCMRI